MLKTFECVGCNSNHVQALVSHTVKMLSVAVEPGNHFYKMASQFVKVMARLGRNREHLTKLFGESLTTMAVSIEAARLFNIYVSQIVATRQFRSCQAFTSTNVLENLLE